MAALAMKQQPLPASPTNADLARYAEGTHACVETGNAEFRRGHRTLSRRIKNLEAGQAGIETQLGHVNAALGIDKDGRRVKRPILLMSQLELFSKLTAVAFSVIFCWQVGAAVWPGVEEMGRGLVGYALHGLPGAAPTHAKAR